MAQSPQIVADNVYGDRNPANVSSFFTYNAGWNVEQGGFLDSCTVPVPDQHNASNPAKANLTFSGTTAFIWGTLKCNNTPSACGYTVVLDDNPPETISAQKLYDVPLYNTSSLSDGTHNIQIVLDDNASLRIDYALITPSTTTDLGTAMLFVNHTDPTIEYIGEWRMSVDGHARESFTRGAEIRFAFAGYAVKAFSRVELLGAGNMTLEVSLDDQTAVPVVIKDPSDPFGGAYNNAYYEFYDSPYSGNVPNHKMAIKLVDISGEHTFAFQAFAYYPSFDTIADMPTLTLENPSSNRNKIIGITIGSTTAFLVIALFSFLFMRRRRRRQRARTSVSIDFDSMADPYLKAVEQDPLPAVASSSNTEIVPAQQQRILSMIDRLNCRLEELQSQPPPAYAVE